MCRLLLIFMFVIPMFGYTQNDTALYDVEIITNLKKVQIMVDDSVLFKRNKFKINAGTHYIKIWSPDYKMLDKVIIVKTNNDNVFQFGLKPANKMVKELTDVQKFDNHKKINYTMSSIIIIGGATVGAFFHSKMNGYAKKYNSYFKAYPYSLSKSQILNIKREMTLEKKNYTQAKVLSIFGYSLLGIGLGYMTFTIIKYKNSKRPKEYTPELKTPWEGSFKLGYSENGVGINFNF